MIATPHTYLESGTEIKFKTYKAVIVKIIKSKDQFGMPINVFRIKLTHKLFCKRYKKIENGKIQDVNYSFINY